MKWDFEMSKFSENKKGILKFYSRVLKGIQKDKELIDARPVLYNTCILLLLHIFFMLVSEMHIPPCCRLTPFSPGLPGRR